MTIDENETFLKNLTVKDCSRNLHLCEKSIVRVADLSIWSKSLTVGEMVTYTTCRLENKKVALASVMLLLVISGVL